MGLSDRRGRDNLNTALRGATGVGIAPSLGNLYWIHIPKDTKSRAEFALARACAYGRTAAATLLLEHGVSPASADNSAMTALHWAAGTATWSSSISS